MNEKKENKKKQPQLHTKVRWENVQSQQVHDLRDRNLAAKGASAKQAEITVKWSNILQCLCNATTTTGEKKKRKKETREM